MSRRVAVLCPECGALNAFVTPVEPTEVVRFLVCPHCETAQHVDLVDPSKIISDLPIGGER